MTTITGPWTTGIPIRCEFCGDTALRDSTRPALAGPHVPCLRCIRRGVLPSVAEIGVEQLDDLIDDAAHHSGDYHRRLLAEIEEELADRARYETVAAIEAVTKDGETVWTFEVQRCGDRIHAEMNGVGMARPLALSLLSADDAETVGKALLEAAERARHQERHAKRS